MNKIGIYTSKTIAQRSTYKRLRQNLMEEKRLTRVVLDILKPHEPHLTEFAEYLCSLDEIERLEITVIERDETTETLEAVINGDLNYDGLRLHMAVKGAAIHSVDEVTVA